MAERAHDDDEGGDPMVRISARERIELKKGRNDQGLSTDAFARKAGVSKTLVSFVENGKTRQMRSARYLRYVRTALRASLSEATDLAEESLERSDRLMRRIARSLADMDNDELEDAAKVIEMLLKRSRTETR
jgi:transcriptional regulator with XRE-family HTH domain